MFSIKEDPLPLIVFAKIHFNPLPLLTFSKTDERLARSWPSTSKDFIPSPSIFSLIGFNSDYLGFKISLEKWLPNINFNALVLGSGGSSNAICYALKKLNINYKIVSTSNPSYFSYEDIRHEEIYSKYKLIINTTPLGMSPNIDSFPNIQYKFLNSNSYLYDLVYNPKQTKFLSKGKKNNSYTKNGLEMLETQAKISWDIWNK